MTSSSKIEAHLAPLVHHVELSKAGWRDRALDTMVIATCYLSDSPLIQEEISTQLNSQLPAPLGEAQIKDVIDRLISRSSLVRLSEGRFKLSEAAKAEIATNFEEASQAETRARERFEARFESIGEVPVSWEQFRDEFLTPLISELGARTYEIISGTSNPAVDAQAYVHFLDRFPEKVRPRISSALSEFLDPHDNTIRRLILSHLNATLLVKATGLHEAAFTALTAATTRRLQMTVFVDTNFLFSLLGLHENPADDVVEALDALITSTGHHVDVQLYALPITLDEARYTLANYRDVVSGIILTPQMARAIAKDNHDFSGIAIKYIQEAKTADSPISADEYFEPYLENLVEVCRDKGVEFYNADLDALRTDQRVIDDLAEEKAYQEDHRAKGAKPYPVLLHDMVLWHFVHDQRLPGVESPVDARYWIATMDFGLIRFDRYKRRDSRELPITIHPTVLLQILQFWVPQSESLEIALVESLRPMLPTVLDPDAERVTLRILRVLSRYENIDEFSEETLSNILVDDVVRSRIQTTVDLKAQAEIVEAALVKQLSALERKAKALEKKLEKATSNADAESERLRVELGERTRERDSLDTALHEEKEEAEKLAARVGALEGESERRKTTNTRIAFATATILLCGFLAWSISSYLVPKLIPHLRYSPGFTHALAISAAVLVGLSVADLIGARISPVRNWVTYSMLHQFRRYLWTVLVTIALSLLAAAIDRSAPQ